MKKSGQLTLKQVKRTTHNLRTDNGQVGEYDGTVRSSKQGFVERYGAGDFANVGV